MNSFAFQKSYCFQISHKSTVKNRCIQYLIQPVQMLLIPLPYNIGKNQVKLYPASLFIRRKFLQKFFIQFHFVNVNSGNLFFYSRLQL